MKNLQRIILRQREIYCQDERGAVNYRFDTPNQSIAQYKHFMRATGLFDLLANHVISNLYDYATGVEVGLDSNGRKNRGGHQMERLVEKFLREAGGTSAKRFDFVVEAAAGNLRGKI